MTKKKLIYFAIAVSVIVIIQGVIYSESQPTKTTQEKYEANWRSPTTEEIGLIAPAFGRNKISCGEFLVRKGNDEANYYLCACRTRENDKWRGYQVWTTTEKALYFNDENIIMP